MELIIKNGDYVPDGKGGFCRAEGEDELLSRVLWSLTARRGSFPFLPQVGSRLHLLLREKPGARLALARQYVTEALAGEQDLTVDEVQLAQGKNGDLAVTVTLNHGGEAETVTVGIGGEG